MFYISAYTYIISEVSMIISASFNVNAARKTGFYYGWNVVKATYSAK